MTPSVEAQSAPERDADLDAAVQRCPFHRLLGVRLVETHQGERAGTGVRIGLEIRQELRRSDEGDALHGGVIASLLDIAAAYAVRREKGAGWMTVSLSTEYLRPVFGARVEARGEVVRAGRSMAWADIELVEGDTLCAIGRALFAAPRGD